MADIGLAIAPLAVGILKVTREIIKVSSDVRNFQEEWNSFCEVIARLSNELDNLQQDRERNPGIQLAQNDHYQIEQLLEECRDFMREQPDSLQSPRVRGTVARVRWILNPNNKEKLRGHRDKVNEIYIQVIHPFLIRAAPHLALHHRAQPDPGPSHSQPEIASTGSVHASRSLSWSSSADTKCPVSGGESVEEKEELPTEAILASNFERLNIKVKLFLDKNLERVAELRFDEFHSGVTRDSNTATLALRAPNRKVRLTQIGSAGWIPITSKRSPLEAIIQSPASLTDHDGGTKEVHQSRFSFENPESRKRFQECLRGRKLLGEFKTEEISVNNSKRALAQLIQVWSGNWRSTATISYHDSTTKKCQEWHLEYFEAESTTKRKVDMRPLFPKTGREGRGVSIQITFKKPAEAEEFMEIFNSHRQIAPSLPDPLPRSPSPTTTVATSTTYSSRTSTNFFSKELLAQYGTN